MGLAADFSTFLALPLPTSALAVRAQSFFASSTMPETLADTVRYVSLIQSAALHGAAHDSHSHGAQGSGLVDRVGRRSDKNRTSRGHGRAAKIKRHGVPP